MKPISILNDVLGPVMRGPSSSHTAGAFHLASLARSLLGEAPAEAEICFDPDGSYSRTYREQGADRAFAVGLLDWPLTDPRFEDSLDLAKASGLKIEFQRRNCPKRTIRTRSVSGWSVAAAAA